MEGSGLDIIILSVGTNDAARIQKFCGINPDVDLDRLVHIRIEQWPAQILDMYRSLMTCLDQYGKVLFFLPIGIASVSNNDTGISYFRQLAIHFAKQFPKISIVNNANMIRNNHALPSMIRSANDPHFSERGRSQVIANLKAVMRFGMPALSAYSTMVNNHMMNPHRPAPHAQFLRRGAAHTGIPDPPSPSEEIPPARRPRSSEPASSTPQETSSVSVGSTVRQCRLDRTYTSYATVAGQGARPSAEASTGCPPTSTSEAHPLNNLSDSRVDPPPVTRSTTPAVTSRDRSGERSQGARPKETLQAAPVGLPQRPPSKTA